MNLEDLKRYSSVSPITSEITGNEIITNKTRQYLLPSFRQYGKKFIDEFNQLSFFAAGVYDAEREIHENTVTILVKGRKSKINLNLPNLVDEYFFGELLYGKFHALVIRLPVPNLRKNFLEGNFSKMYKQPEKIFKLNTKDSFKKLLSEQALSVCTKSNKYRTHLESIIGAGIDTNAELDSVPDLAKEILNYERN